MRIRIHLFLLISSFAVSCHKASVNSEEKHSSTNNNLSTDTISQSITGDFDGDGNNEKAWLASPNIKELISKYGQVPGVGDSYIRFSNPNIPSIKIESCIGGQPVNEGDLNDDGADEIGLLPEWWTSNWYAYYVYTFGNEKWKLAVDPISIYGNDFYEKKIDVIRKNPKKHGYVIIQFINVNDTDFIFKTKSIRVRR